MALSEVLGWPRRNFWLLAAALGVVDVVAGRLVSAGAGASAVGAVFTVAILALTGATGAAARSRGERPGWAGALPGLIYGAIGGIPLFFAHESVAQARAILAREHVALRTTPAALAASANTLSTHLLEFVLAVLFVTVLGILAGTIGAAFVRRPREEDRHAV
jgi:hypothetical protein